MRGGIIGESARGFKSVARFAMDLNISSFLGCFFSKFFCVFLPLSQGQSLGVLGFGEEKGKKHNYTNPIFYLQ